eukprot:GEMP01065408.1.p1 GENE.GEMP01065408.1~~GEMP01065408.1.p1  ORF type:complete len:116 (+),score=30.25 GEMP01065408.1:201-548(+)
MSIVQYVVVRTDLKWPLGAVVAQGCHASVAAVTQALRENSADATEYTKDLATMTKFVLAGDSEEQLVQISEKLKEANIGHWLWQEQPENVPSALASFPAPKEQLQPFFKKFKLLK